MREANLRPLEFVHIVYAKALFVLEVVAEALLIYKSQWLEHFEDEEGGQTHLRIRLEQVGAHQFCEVQVIFEIV